VKPLRVPVESLSVGDCALDRDASNYVLRVHRMHAGQPLVLFDPLRSVEATATLLHATANVATCRVEAIRDARAVPTHAVSLLQALAKGDKLDRVVRDAVALGVGRIIFVVASRSVVRLKANESQARRQRWQRIATESARQSGRGNIPELVGPLSLEDGAARVEDCSLRLLLSPQAPTRLALLLAGCAAQPVALCIGPEGGLTSAEAIGLSKRGFQAVRFGDFTLRTETAATAVLGALVDWGMA
jgi:16S rRNA (uracil1498-N3)-methyltransferase